MPALRRIDGRANRGWALRGRTVPLRRRAPGRSDPPSPTQRAPGKPRPARTERSPPLPAGDDTTRPRPPGLTGPIRPRKPDEQAVGGGSFTEEAVGYRWEHQSGEASARFRSSEDASTTAGGRHGIARPVVASARIGKHLPSVGLARSGLYVPFPRSNAEPGALEGRPRTIGGVVYSRGRAVSRRWGV
jgi:hypothetical protein